MNTFTETQQNPYRWYLVVFLIGMLAIAYWYLSHMGIIDLWRGEDKLVLSIAMGGSLIFWTFFTYAVGFRRIITIINTEQIQFRAALFGKATVIKWTDIERAYVREFALIGEYPQGVGGIRQGPNGWAYVMSGTEGLQIIKKSGGKILIGTQRPDELRAFLSTLAVTPHPHHS